MQNFFLDNENSHKLNHFGANTKLSKSHDAKTFSNQEDSDCDTIDETLDQGLKKKVDDIKTKRPIGRVGSFKLGNGKHEITNGPAFYYIKNSNSEKLENENENDENRQNENPFVAKKNNGSFIMKKSQVEFFDSLSIQWILFHK